MISQEGAMASIGSRCGRPVNSKFWTFYGVLSNVEYTVTVTDTRTGTVKTCKNPSGRFASMADTNAF
jgi:hypothetical protein